MRLSQAIAKTGAPACVGLDPHLDRLPGAPHANDPEATAQAVRTFCLGAIEAVAGIVPAVKPQVAFFEALGWRGAKVLEEVVREARSAGLIVVLDCKRGDIGSTAQAYARATLVPGAPLESDSVTLSPYLGAESLQPFVAQCDDHGRGIFVLVRTSNPGSDAWQVGRQTATAVADQLEAWNLERLSSDGFGPCGAVIAANLPKELSGWRERMPHTWFLMPGYGAQGATAQDLAPLLANAPSGVLVTSSRAVLFPPPGQVETDWRAAVLRRARAFVDDLRGVC